MYPYPWYPDGLDYSARTQVLTFDQNNVGFNISIPVLNDDIHEPAEDFFGRLMTGDSDVSLSPNSTRIRIIDDDSMFTTCEVIGRFSMYGITNQIMQSCFQHRSSSSEVCSQPVQLY